MKFVLLIVFCFIYQSDQRKVFVSKQECEQSTKIFLNRPLVDSTEWCFKNTVTYEYPDDFRITADLWISIVEPSLQEKYFYSDLRACRNATRSFQYCDHFCDKCEDICEHCPRNGTWVMTDKNYNASCFCEMIDNCDRLLPAPSGESKLISSFGISFVIFFDRAKRSSAVLVLTIQFAISIIDTLATRWRYDSAALITQQFHH